MAKSNNAFGLDLYKQFQEEQGNLFFSPYSISSALTMAYEGAGGQTAEEMKTVLHLPDNRNDIRSGYQHLHNDLIKENAPYQLTTANALWLQEGYPFEADYLNIVKTYYFGRAVNLDFKTKTEASRLTINEWVESKTHNRIENLIPKGMLSPATRSILTNAIYFKADWLAPFEGRNTREGRFTLSSGKEVAAQMMHQTAHFHYGETDTLQILEMDYVGNDLSMLIILPRKNGIDSIERLFSAENLDAWKNAMQNEKVRVTLPKFKFETKYFMRQDLKEMGMPIAFKYPDADFKAMSPTGELCLDEVIHQTFVEVAEYGTEAAAATAVVMRAGAAPVREEPKIFNADHPFIFIIQQKASGIILFMGRMRNPT